MTKWKPIFSHESLYFITTSAHNHNPIFEDNVIKQIIIDLFDCYRRRNYFRLFSFVLMPTHIHLISRFPNQVSLSDFMRNFKSLSANRILRYLQAINYDSLFDAVIKESNTPNKKVWEDSYLAKEIYSLPFLEQKIDYIHQNPCRPPWKIINNPEDYPWSSAGFYLTDKPCIIPIDDIRALLV
ncbi:MAG: transposase [Anaerolineales bacterium]|nr:transposase [Anaerolineales bacterium]